jgi:chemotaxis protein MotA
MGSSLLLFIDLPSVMIVFGGTFGCSMINYPLPDILKVIKVVKNAFFVKPATSGELIAKFVNLAGVARREGILALESALNDISDDFMKKGLQLSVDGLEPTSLRISLDTEIENIKRDITRGGDIQHNGDIRAGNGYAWHPYRACSDAPDNG